MTVAVVVPCHNEAAHIGALLDALAAQSHRPDAIVIVDDRSADDTRSVVAAWSDRHPGANIRILDGPGRGPGPAMNAGIRATTSDIIMRMDGHSIPAADYLERCLDVLASGAGSRAAGVAGGVWLVKPGADTPVARAIAAVVSHPMGSGGAPYRHPAAGGPKRSLVETVPFGTFPRAVWERLGGFDEALAANQDFDFNYRARKAGFDVVLDRDIRATYFARPTLRALARQYVRYGFWKVQMLRKDPRATHPRQLPPALVLPWVAGTMGWALLWPGPVSWAAVALYPAVVAAAALHISIRGDNVFAAAAALAAVHLSWSAGFWKAALTGTRS